MKKKLNIFNIPLNGINLIEASAGTGKTSAIVLIYLRLLLGISSKKNVKPLLIQEILVVTFTNFAKEEIYKRIKKSIDALHLYCINKDTNNTIIKTFFKKIKNFKKTIYILEKAKKNINKIAIYTIHEFCKNILQSFFFNTSINIIENEQLLYIQATEDFWRSYFYKLPKEIINITYQYYQNPLSLFVELKPIFNFSKIYFTKKFNKNENIITCHDQNIKTINIFKKKWLSYYIIILEIIKKIKLNKKTYNEYNISRWTKNITNWAKSRTQDYTIPNTLKYFSQENIFKDKEKQKNLYHTLFQDIENILKKKFSLKNIILFEAIRTINKFLKKEKKNKFLLGFNDLLSTLLKHIKLEKNLKTLILKKYPVAFIDEFQDTDVQQYEIFNILYNINTEKTGLFLVGDPKQSIYSFRGADIFSYLKAKSSIQQYYYLNTNWRSSINICKAINYLFTRNKNSFFFKNIPYINVSYSLENENIKFKIQGRTQNAINIFFKKQEKIHIEEYQEWIAKQCANQICSWLIYAQKGEAILINKNKEKVLQESDIVVLVRNKDEANIIHNALKKVNITSIYLSSTQNIFQTKDASELLIILKTILNPTDINLLKQSIFTHIFYQILLKGQKQENINKLHFIIKKLYKYREIWKNIGILYTVKMIILDYQKYSNNVNKSNYYQKNINFLHIAELLAEQSEYLYQESSLIKWFEKRTLDNTKISENENIRYFKQSKLIKIITIHKSKGLEYPIVWIPFATTYKQSKSHLYHNKKNYKIFFDLNQSKETKKIVDEERLAEDLRFLYVAITRAIYHCSLGSGDIINKKNQQKSDTHKSALGYIIQRGYYMNYDSLLKEINLFNNKSYIKIIHDTTNIKFISRQEDVYLLSSFQHLTNTQYYFQMTSFTKLRKENNSYDKNKDNYSINNIFIKPNIDTKSVTFENFPQGKTTGILIHYILNKINFTKKLNINFFFKVLKKYEFPDKWAPILMSWINNIINVKFKNINFNLSMLKNKQYTKELNFFLPIRKILRSIDLNNIIQSFDPISSIAPEISFNPILGILKGSIDLVFFWNKRYYIIDYKSNYLGNSKNVYSLENIKKEIIKNRYDLQYQIYTVALNQYLKKKIKKYQYENHFGGVYYMFLRGITEKNNGIFYTMPKYILIKELTNLFIIK